MKTKSLAVSGLALAAILGAVGFNHWLIDGISGEFWSILFGEDTKYASGYSDAAWRRRQIGEALPDVMRDLGAPIDVWTNDDKSLTMRWSISPGDTHYRTRALVVKEGRVVGKWSEFYVD